MNEKIMDKDCNNCKYFDKVSFSEPCIRCLCKNKWEPKEDKKMEEVILKEIAEKFGVDEIKVIDDQGDL